MKRYSFLLLIMSVLLFGCEKEEEITPIINIETTESELEQILSDPSGGSASIDFSVNVPWSIEIVYENISITEKNWLEINKKAGNEGSVSIDVNVGKNISYEDRVATIIIKANSISKSIKIKQNQRLGLITSTNYISLDYKEQIFTLDVNHNIEYSVEVQSDLFTHIGTKSLTVNTESFSISENTTREKRIGYIIVNSSDHKLSDTVQVCQNPKSLRQLYIEILCNGIWRNTQDRILGFRIPDVWYIRNFTTYPENYLFTTNENYAGLNYYKFDSIYYMGGPYPYDVGQRNDTMFMKFITSSLNKGSFEVKHISEDSLVLHRITFFVWGSFGGSGGNGYFPTTDKYEPFDRGKKLEYIWENDTTSKFYDLLTIKEGWREYSYYDMARYPYEVFDLRYYNNDTHFLYFKKDSVISWYTELNGGNWWGKWYLLGERIKITEVPTIYKIQSIDDSTLVLISIAKESSYARKSYYSRNK